MADRSTIEWTNSTWNPVTGCTKISPGCKNCYAERMAKRLKAMGLSNYRNEFELTLHPQTLGVPLRWRTHRMIFVNSMSDLFHEEVPLQYIQQVFNVMVGAPQHIFQVLTKRAKRLEQLHCLLPWPENIWMGVTVEREDLKSRIDHLRRTRAMTKFISLEPLLGPMPSLDLRGIDWVIVGGESGPHARPVSARWVIDIKNQCIESGVPFFFKQWGGVNKKKTGRILEGRIWDQMPIRNCVF